MTRFVVVSRNRPTVVRYGPEPGDELTLPVGKALAVSEQPVPGKDDPPLRPPIVVRPIEIQPIGPLIQMPSRFDDAGALLKGVTGEQVGFAVSGADRFDLREAQPLARRAAAQGKRLVIELG